MSAVRMVAYGVLEMKPKDTSFAFAFEANEEQIAKEKLADHERDQLRKLVNDELKRYGLLMQRAVAPRARSWRTRPNAHILYNQKVGNRGFAAREVLHEGTFRECCIAAAEVLDRLDAAQVPDTAAG